MGSAVKAEAGFPLVRTIALSVGLTCTLLSFMPVTAWESALTLRDGMTARTLAHYLPWILLLSGAGLLMVGCLAVWAGPGADEWLLASAERLDSAAGNTS